MHIHRGAIADTDKLTLFAVKKEYWSKLNVPYARTWPDYRAPTGVTSGDRKHVANWLKRYSSLSNVDLAIEELQVISSDLISVLDRANIFDQIDILQIDAEGSDDMVIYSSNIAETRPRLINFEATALDQVKFVRLKSHLQLNGYILTRHGHDCLAIRKSSR